MPLTPAEEAELAYLEQLEERRQIEERGRDAVNAAARGRSLAAQPRQERDFSITRAFVGGVRDAFQGVLDSSTDLTDGLVRTFTDTLGETVGEPLGYLVSAATPAGWIANPRALMPTDMQSFADFEGSDEAGTAERVVRSIVSFAVPYTGAARALRVGQAATLLGRVGRGLAAGALTDFTQVDPVSGNIANVLRDSFGIDSAILDSLAAEPDDTRLEQRFKAAAAGAPVGLVGDAVFEAGARLVRLYRAWRGTETEAKAIVESYRADLELDPSARNLPDTVEAPASAGGPDAAAAGAGPKRGERQAYDPSMGLKWETPPETFDDVLDFLKAKANVGDVDPEMLSRFAQNLLDGNPENALAKMGIDPAKLDYSKFDDPETIGRLQTGLAELYETIAKRLGRSNEVINEAAVVSGARALASTPDVLRALYGATSNLPETLMGARLFVGAHAHKMMALADEALKEISGGAPGPKWIEFLDTFHRHAYFLGTLRGAGTEIGRALKSLQFIAKVDRKAAMRTFADASTAEAKAQADVPGRLTLKEGASALSDRAATDAEKIQLLSDLIRTGGDVEEMTRTVRQLNGSVGVRVNEALKETMGNLFGIGTAANNVGSGLLFLGTNLLSKTLTAVGKTVRAPLSAKLAAEARRARLDVWSYGTGIIGGFQEAFANTLLVLEREGMAEAALNLNSLGLDRLAKSASRRSARAVAELGGREQFERADTLNFRAFSVTSEEQARLNAMARQIGGPQFFQSGLTAAARLLGSTVNAAGSLSRLGTTLFINLPDEFVGTLAARAGAKSQALRIAAAEADRLGLDGAELSTFLKARTVQLTGDGKSLTAMVNGGYDAGLQETMLRAGEVEAKAVLFQDDLELSLSRAMSAGLSNVPLMHMFIPFIRTPLRILERTAIDFTPLGLFKARVRKAILNGGPEGEEALARLSLGMLAMVTAFQLAEDRTIVGYDNGPRSSARLSRPSYTLRVGDDVFEFNRLDPMGTLLGLGADMRAYLDEAADDPEASSTVEQGFEAFLWATAANVLSKTWLTSIRNMVDLATPTDDSTFKSRLSNFASSFATRFVPASGVQRAVEGWANGQLVEAAGFTDRLLAASIGADTLPVRRDRILGRPADILDGQRLIGVKAGPQEGDPLVRELEALAFVGPAANRTQRGVRLNATQFSRWLELRGQVVRNPQTGLTLEETLNELIQLPEYQELPPAARIQAIRDNMDGFSELATNSLLDEDDAFFRAALRKEIWKMSNLEGWQPGQREAVLAEQIQLQGR